MSDNSQGHPTEDAAVMRARIAELETRLSEEQTKLERSQNALREATADVEARVREQTTEGAGPDERIQEEIEQRERVQLALQDSEAIYHSLVEHLPICVYRIDLNGRLTFGNSAYLKDIGRSLDELLGRTVFDLFPEEQAGKFDADDRRVIDTGEVFHDVEEHYARGEKLYVEVLKTQVLDHEGQTVGVQGLYWDVTARRGAEERLRKTLAELERSNKDLQQFAGVASHDLHAPLRRIVTLSQMVRDQYEDQLDADAREWLRFIASNVEYMQELINDLLSHSHVGALDTPLEHIDCGPAVSKALRNLEDSTRESGAQVHVRELPTIMANRVELVRLFQNLISNAIKYRGEATPSVDVWAETQDDDWLFHVKDNGIGVAPKDYEKVFEAFQRLHGDEKYPGTGIGLATCKKIVQRLDGRIWIESQVGEGSDFLFTIPRRGLPAMND